MSNVRITKGFINDLAFVRSYGVEQKIKSSMQSISTFPNMGSSNVPRSVIAAYGEGIRKTAVKPFDLIYRYEEDEDLVIFEALIHMRRGA